MAQSFPPPHDDPSSEGGTEEAAILQAGKPGQASTCSAGLGKHVLVTGATGYVGGRLVPRLLEAGCRVRVMVRRDPDRISFRRWAGQVEVVCADVMEPESLPAALDGIDVAYYLIHSMRHGAEYRQRDREAATNFGRACCDAEVEQIVYLGGLGDDDDALSEHLQSRHETGDALRECEVPVTEFRAAVIVGSGSASFEMVRHLAEKLPVMIFPRWAKTRIQPIAIRDVLSYLLAALHTPDAVGRIIEIGGSEVTTFGQMISRYAKSRELRRLTIPVPFLSPWLSSWWIHWTTPITREIARPLIEGARNEVVVQDDAAARLFPAIRPIGYDEAVRLALKRVRDGKVETIWSDAMASSDDDVPPVYLTQEQGMLIERRKAKTTASPEAVFAQFCGFGGERGWPPYNWLWKIRGAMDLAVGGVGLRRGRRHLDRVRVGDAIDFWRVEAVEPDRRLLLRAEMKLPGEGWLQFEAIPLEADPDGRRTKVIQTAYFAPRGLFGYLYWYSVYPLHGLVFKGMLRWVVEGAIRRSANAAEEDTAEVEAVRPQDERVETERVAAR